MLANRRRPGMRSPNFATYSVRKLWAAARTVTPCFTTDCLVPTEARPAERSGAALMTHPEIAVLNFEGWMVRVGATESATTVTAPALSAKRFTGGSSMRAWPIVERARFRRWYICRPVRTMVAPKTSCTGLFFASEIQPARWVSVRTDDHAFESSVKSERTVD